MRCGPALLVLVALLGCRPRALVPNLGAAAGPFFPEPPDPPQVAYVGEVRAPGAGFTYPLDVSCGPGHSIAVADPQAASIWRIDIDSGRSERFDRVGTTPLQSPVGVAHAADGSLLFVDSELAAVFRSGSKSEARTVVHEGAPLARPTAVAAMEDGGFVVVDAGAHALFRLHPQLGMVEVGPGRGEAGAGFNFPVDVELGPDGAAYVSDSVHGMVERLSEGRLDAVAGGIGVGGGPLIRPKGIALEADGTLHVVDAGMQHVQVYAADGRLLGRYGRPGDGPEALGLPGGVCLDQDGHAFVADPLHRRIQVYELLWRTADQPRAPDALLR